MVFTLENYLAMSKEGQWFGFTDHDNKVYANLIIHEGDKPTEQECIDGIAALQADYDSMEWIRNRQAEYPSIQDVTVALAEKEEGDSTMWDEITAKRAAVKAKYSKS